MPEVVAGAGEIAGLFSAVSTKLLSAVEADSGTSNQHELNGSAELIHVFGRPVEKMRISTRFVFVSDDDPLLDETQMVTFYDARASHPTRTEFRFYYPAASEVMGRASPGDQIIVANRTDGTALIIVGDPASTMMVQLSWVFGLTLAGAQFASTVDQGEHHHGIDLPVLQVLEQIGIEVQVDPDERYRDAVECFGGEFPSTREFSAFAREFVGPAAGGTSPDDLLMSWMSAEESLFRALERRVVEEEAAHLLKTDPIDVDEFVKVSLRVQNRRKSRAGKGLENHLIALFDMNGVQNTFNPLTENRSRPDFVMPSIEAYWSSSGPEDDLTVLGAKTTCKDRWRQVLSEGQRVQKKYLATLESPISSNQLVEMRESGVQLVIPSSLHGAFRDEDREHVMSVEDFIRLVLRRQALTEAGFEVL